MADIFAALGERRAQRLALASLGDAALALHDAAAAGQAFIEALRIAAEAQILPLGLHALLGVAALHVRNHHPADAYVLRRKSADTTKAFVSIFGPPKHRLPPNHPTTSPIRVMLHRLCMRYTAVPDRAMCHAGASVLRIVRSIHGHSL